MSEIKVGGFVHWQDADGTWWYRDVLHRPCVATLAMVPYLEVIAAEVARRERAEKEVKRVVGLVMEFGQAVRSRYAREAIPDLTDELIELDAALATDTGGNV